MLNQDYLALVTPPHQQAYISGEGLERIAVGTFGKGPEHLQASLLYQPFQLGVGKKVIVAIQGLTPGLPGHANLSGLKPEPGLPAVPYRDKGFATRL
jgi:hypothetical protein